MDRSQRICAALSLFCRVIRQDGGKPEVVHTAVKTRLLPGCLDLVCSLHRHRESYAATTAAHAVGAISTLCRSRKIQESLPGNPHFQRRWVELVECIDGLLADSPGLAATTVLMIHSLATSMGGTKTLAAIQGLGLLHRCAEHHASVLHQACKVYEALADRLHILLDPAGNPSSTSGQIQRIEGLPLLLAALDSPERSVKDAACDALSSLCRCGTSLLDYPIMPVLSALEALLPSIDWSHDGDVASLRLLGAICGQLSNICALRARPAAELVLRRMATSCVEALQEKGKKRSVMATRTVKMILRGLAMPDDVLDLVFEEDDDLNDAEKQALLALYDSPAVGYAKRPLTRDEQNWKNSCCLEHHGQELNLEGLTAHPVISWPRWGDPTLGSCPLEPEAMDPSVCLDPATGATMLRQRRVETRSWQDVVFDRKEHLPPGPGAGVAQPRSLKKKKKKKDKAAEEHSLLENRRPNDARPPLVFDSNFECGNLSKAVQVSEWEYDCEASVDYNTNGHTQWFFFSVRGADPEREYIFNISNFEKSSSLFNQGLQPVLFDPEQGGDWKRSGRNIWYGKTGLHTEEKKKYNLSFTAQFPTSGVCYLAYSVPYGLSDLRRSIAGWSLAKPEILSHSVLCTTMGGIELDLLTITDPAVNPKEKKLAALSARVHPGEVNSSWMMHGAIELLLADTEEARELRKRYVWKIVPMLNPDGVVLGNYRCSMAGLDLNRNWKEPNARITAEIFSLKRMLREIHTKEAPTTKKGEVVFYCDLHGHSKATDTFMYGCYDTDSSTGHRTAEERLLPYLISKLEPRFSFLKSKYHVGSSKEGTGRVVGWRCLGLINCFTLEASLPLL